MQPPSQQDFLSRIRQAVSDERFAAYQSRANQNDLLALSYYSWNISLCESLYPALQTLEVILRNGINDAAIAEFGTAEWFYEKLLPEDRKFVSEIEQRLIRQGKPRTAGNFIAESSFGFWVSLFSGRYHRGVWPRLLASVFPGMPTERRSLGRLRSRLQRILHLRNRVFHHEPIWYWQDLTAQHRLTMDVTGWISPEMRQFVELLDRFPAVHQLGAEEYRRRIAASLPG